jgi:uncharacterized membrane protein (DUF485 family)
MNKRFWMIAAVLFSLLIGFGIYYMATVDAMDASVDSGWLWFLGAAIVFVSLEIYFSRGSKHNQPTMERYPDEPEQHD